ncbi:DUF397 domain-containing protein [Streptomyces sp. SAJ15]|uniref:DUF397 domain-containing protein n=1 Tax=Streptomyces sp. SAJ15 TaxID=2011095 RepID=UPI00118630A8|nr:DUF397 domain-containing protein [Streptomyces sp. SAJ15]TVL89978.1 DUF397 domain-containing protein [Streptomyces sp. SAJ15]
MRTTRIDLSIADWRKSTYSTGGNGCIEITEQFPGVVPVRDSKNPEGPALVFSSDGWSSFVDAVKRGEL